MAQRTGEPALLPILQGPEAAPFEHLYREALNALHEVMQQAGASHWQAELLAMRDEWDHTRAVSRFRAAGRGLGDLIMHSANFPALNQVQAAWLDCCLDLLVAAAQTSLDVVRPPDLSGLNAYQIGVMKYEQARLQEQVGRVQAATQGAPDTPGKPLEVAIWDEVIDRHPRVQDLHSLSGSRCRVCWRRFVSPADVWRLRWRAAGCAPACRARWSTGADSCSSCALPPVSRMPRASGRSAPSRRRSSMPVPWCCRRRRTPRSVRTVARGAMPRGCGGTWWRSRCGCANGPLPPANDHGIAAGAA